MRTGKHCFTKKALATLKTLPKPWCNWTKFIQSCTCKRP